MKVGDKVKINDEVIGTIEYLDDVGLAVDGEFYAYKTNIIEVISVGAKILIFIDSVVSYVKKWFNKK